VSPGDWILASRPKTLTAATIPVVVGSALAFRYDGFQPVPALLCLAFAVLVQIGTNFANDYFDWKQGADTEERTGPTRAVAAGLISPTAMVAATVATLVTAFCIGLFLVKWGGWWLVAVGLASVLSAVAYTAKPVALGYRGLGDVFVVFFFGIVAVGLTTYVQLGSFPPAVGPVGLAIGLLSNNLLVVNNYRDFESDAQAGKRTLIVRFGPACGEALILSSFLVSAFVSLGLALFWGQWQVLLSLLGLRPVWRVYRRLPRALRREGFSSLLPRAANGLLLYGILLSVGLVVGP